MGGVDMTLQVVRVAGLIFIFMLSIVAALRNRSRLIFYFSAATSGYLAIVYAESFFDWGWDPHTLIRSGWIFLIVVWMGLLINYIDSGK